MDIWNDPDQDISAIRRDLKSYMVIIKHHAQSNEAGVQDIDLCSAGGWSEGDSSVILMIRSMHLSPLHTRLETAYKAKKKWSGNQNQGRGVDGEIVVKSGRAKIRQAQEETPRFRYDTPPKDKSKLVIYSTLHTTPTTEANRSVVAVIKKMKIEGDAAPTAKKVRLKQAGDRRE